jgi:hypothetical protein
VFDWCCDLKIPVAFVLAGGYVGDSLDEAGLIDIHRLTLRAAATSYSGSSFTPGSELESVDASKSDTA